MMVMAVVVVSVNQLILKTMERLNQKVVADDESRVSNEFSFVIFFFHYEKTSGTGGEGGALIIH